MDLGYGKQRIQRYPTAKKKSWGIEASQAGKRFESASDTCYGSIGVGTITDVGTDSTESCILLRSALASLDNSDSAEGIW
jgi:hypothetical protein